MGLRVVTAVSFAALVGCGTNEPPPPAMPFLQQTITCDPDPELRGEESRLLAEINRIRGQAGLGPLRPDRRLASAAHAHACDTARQGMLSHQGADGSTPDMRALRSGYRYAVVAENLGLGFRTAQQAVGEWMKSPGHRRNILLPQATDAALGLSLAQKGRKSWVLMVARER